MVNGRLPGRRHHHCCAKRMVGRTPAFTLDSAEIRSFSDKLDSYRNDSNFLKNCPLFDLNMDKNRSVKPTGPSSVSARFTTVAAEHAAGTLGTSMRFLLKLTFWLGLVLVLLPSGGSQPAPNMPVNATEAFSAARAAVTDMQSFCERQVQACVVGSQTAVAIGHRAQAGAKMLYEFLNEKLGPDET